MRCSNTEALNKYLSGEEQFEKVQELRSMTRNYQKEYDMTDALSYILPDIILEELNIKI